MNSRGKNNPGVLAPPPVLYLAAVLIGLAVNYLAPISLVPDRARYPIGVAVIILSGLIMPFVLVQFRRARTTFDVRKATTAIITSGPFRFSRNPSYVSLTLLCLGIGIAADNLWIIVMLIPNLVVMQDGVILREERFLERTFGEEYLRYKKSVRRWL